MNKWLKRLERTANEKPRGFDVQVEKPKPLTADQFGRLLDRVNDGLNLSRKRLLDLLSDDDVTGIRAGVIPAETVRAYAEVWAKREPELGNRDIRRDTRADIKRITCGDCKYFRPDKIGDGAGIGSCAANAGRFGSGAAFYPNAKRFCDKFKRDEQRTN